MPQSLMADAFAHHVWATERVLEACAGLTDEQLATTVPGTYGTILDTLRHTVGADRSYLYVIGSGRHERVEEDTMDLAQLQGEWATHGAAWTEILDKPPDPDEQLVRHRDDGSSTRAPTGLRLAQALHHGTDHRSQIATALTQLGIEPPDIDLWAYGEVHGRVAETLPTS
jgi:uncharacterized damage-inducible protein DinB